MLLRELVGSEATPLFHDKPLSVAYLKRKVVGLFFSPAPRRHLLTSSFQSETAYPLLISTCVINSIGMYVRMSTLSGQAVELQGGMKDHLTPNFEPSITSLCTLQFKRASALFLLEKPYRPQADPVDNDDCGYT